MILDKLGSRKHKMVRQEKSKLSTTQFDGYMVTNVGHETQRLFRIENKSHTYILQIGQVFVTIKT